MTGQERRLIGGKGEIWSEPGEKVMWQYCPVHVMFLLQLSIFLIHPFCFVSHFLKEIGVVRSNSCRTGMVGA